MRHILTALILLLPSVASAREWTPYLRPQSGTIYQFNHGRGSLYFGSGAYRGVRGYSMSNGRVTVHRFTRSR